jgi:hypothetical protein
LLLAVAAALSSTTPRNQLSTYLWIALLVASLLPTPSYPQYFCLLIPFLIIDAVAILSAISPPALHRLRPILIPTGLAYLGLGVYDAHRYLGSGWLVPGVVLRERAARWSIPTVERVATAIDAQHVPEAISWWPGYFVSSRTRIVPELANDFGFVVAGRLAPAERRRLHLVTHGEVAAWIREQRYSLVVAGNWTASQEADLLPKMGYGPVRVEGVTFWMPRPPP